MNAPLSPSDTKDILVREYDRRSAQFLAGEPGLPAGIAAVAVSISEACGSDFHKTEALLTDALIERGDIDPVCPDFIPAWLEGEAAS